MIANNGVKGKRDISAKITAEQKFCIKCYMRGAVYGYCTDRTDARISLSVLFGGENKIWDNTPLIVLYQYYLDSGSSEEEAFKSAGKDAGILLREALEEDAYSYELIQGDRSNEYRRI